MLVVVLKAATSGRGLPLPRINPRTATTGRGFDGPALSRPAKHQPRPQLSCRPTHRASRKQKTPPAFSAAGLSVCSEQSACNRPYGLPVASVSKESESRGSRIMATSISSGLPPPIYLDSSPVQRPGQDWQGRAVGREYASDLPDTAQRPRFAWRAQNGHVGLWRRMWIGK